MDKVGEQLPTVGTTVAGLVLVFLGMVIAAWESYEANDKNAVRGKYRSRIWLTFFGLLSSLLSASFGLIGIASGHNPKWLDVAGVSCLALSFVLIILAAFIAVKEI
jgi:uncharacterized membrane protein